MKKMCSLLLVACMLVSLAACGITEQSKSESSSQQPEASVVQESKNTFETSEEPITITVGVPTAPPALPLLRMMETKALGESVKIELDIWNEPEILIAMVQDGGHDMFAFPLTVVSTLYNKGIDVRLMNVNTWGVTYFMTSDPDFKEWADLKGKTVYIPLQSSPPDVLTQYFISEAGLEIGKDVKVIYATTAEVAAMLASGDAVYATLIEPQVTKAMMSNPDLQIAFNFEDEWQRVNNTETKIPNAGFGTTQRFIDENPELVSKFQEAYEEATVWANENPEEMGALAEKYLGLKAPLISKALPNMGLSYKASLDAKEELSMFYQLLYEFNPKMIGGKIADDGMYYNAE
ncbi:MAG: hypothetical protein APF77_15775 [Clostridia bacterium BRH_c25]|nr:MAG: hypothetical protein APF77_15775 [Clostridia bacterium BRH_c25]